MQFVGDEIVYVYQLQGRCTDIKFDIFIFG